jgi:hypothetical protein
MAWAVVLHAVSSPGQTLGGLVSERLRWLERFVLGCGVVVGYRLGSLGRHAVRTGKVRNHIGVLRWILWPAAAAAAAGMILFRAYGADEGIRVLFVGFTSYWAGLDLGFGAYPLACGAEYSLIRPIRSRPTEARTAPEPGDPPHWLGL